MRKIAHLLGVADTTIANWLEAYQPDEDQARHEDMQTLEVMLAEALNQMTTRYVKVNAGVIVEVVLKDKAGNLVLDDKGLPVRVPMEDVEPRLKAVLAGLKVLERKAKMMGTDKEKFPGPEAPVGGKAALDAEKAVVATEEVLRRNGLLKRPAADDVVDVGADDGDA